MFQIISKDGSQRNGLLATKNGEIHTPFFMPIATKAAVKNITTKEVRELGAEIILSNTYHLWLRPGDDVVKKSGGLHKFMNWNGPILTDSGGFQIFSLGPARNPAKQDSDTDRGRRRESFVTLTDEGAEFVDPLDGKKHFMSPEKSIEIQLNLDSDIIMVLDECSSYPCTHEEAERAVARTTDWAKRCKSRFEFANNSNLRIYEKKQFRPLIFAIVQGGVYEDLRKKSAMDLVNIGFDGYAIGGVAVGEPREKMREILEWVLPILPEDKPRYLMGLGRPEEIVAAVSKGIDMFDCVIPTREGRHGRLFIWKDKDYKFETADADFYETINITNEKYREDFGPVDENCGCDTCKNYSKAYLRHLFQIGEPLALRLGAIHNLKFYMDLIQGLRNKKQK